MDQWKRDHPEANWVEQQKERHALKSRRTTAICSRAARAPTHTYGNYTERDILTWARETEKIRGRGSRIFHDADALGSTLAVSCDMCHPHASNTHRRLSQIPGAVGPCCPVARYDQLVRRESGSRVKNSTPTVPSCGLGGVHSFGTPRGSDELRQALAWAAIARVCGCPDGVRHEVVLRGARAMQNMVS
jgi:hypothetical protein